VAQSAETPRLSRCADDLRLDVAQSVLAEEDFVADEEGRTAEGAARDARFSVLDEALLDRGLLRPRQQDGGIEAGSFERCASSAGPRKVVFSRSVIRTLQLLPQEPANIQNEGSGGLL
jgi:hypothetical protein